MTRLNVIAGLLLGLGAPSLYADFTYESTTKITGGALVGMMKFAAAMSKDARKAMDPITATTVIKGDRMVHKANDSASIIDLDKETITTVNFAQRTYSVMTFAQMRQAMEEMQQKITRKPSDTPAADMQFDIKLNDTGKTKTINGNIAHEMVLTMLMQGQDAKSEAKGGLDVTTDMWLAPKIPGYEEVREFNKHMSAKLNWMPGANPLMNRPDMQRAMTELYQQGSKMEGMPVFEVIKIGGKMEGMPDSSSSQAQASRPSNPPPTSATDAMGSILGSRLGLGGLGRRKKESSSDSNSSNSSAGGPANSGSASGSLMEMTMEVSSYSSAPAEAAMFEIPSGFTQVKPDTTQPGTRKGQR
jgi:hypothetical protein